MENKYLQFYIEAKRGIAMAAGSRNPHLIGMKEDNLYHIGIKADTSTQEIKEKFGDVKVSKIPVPSIS